MTGWESEAGTVTGLVLDALPEHERTHLVCDEESMAVPASMILDPCWLGEQIRLRGLIWGIDDPFVLGTLWWYSASNWLTLPTIASSFLTGTALSPALDDVLLHWRTDSRICGAQSNGLLEGELAPALAESLGAAIECVAAICGKGERRLWSIAVDALAGRYLWVGQATGLEDEAMRTVRHLVGDLPGRLPQPRFQPAASHTVVRRGSCCLLYLVPERTKCSSCPRQTPTARRERLG